MVETLCRLSLLECSTIVCSLEFMPEWIINRLLLFCPIGLLLQPVKLKDKEDVVDSLILDQVVAKAFSHNAYKKSVYICLSIVVSYYDV